LGDRKPCGEQNCERDEPADGAGWKSHHGVTIIEGERGRGISGMRAGWL
jgi:hypothetical protein